MTINSPDKGIIVSPVVVVVVVVAEGGRRSWWSYIHQALQNMGAHKVILTTEPHPFSSFSYQVDRHLEDSKTLDGRVLRYASSWVGWWGARTPVIGEVFTRAAEEMVSRRRRRETARRHLVITSLLITMPPPSTTTTTEPRQCDDGEGE